MVDFMDALGRVATVLQAAPSGVPGRIWDQLGPWFARLAVNAAPKWLPRLTLGFPCAVPVYAGGEYRHGCTQSAVAACDVCGNPCCLSHARIDHQGDAICYVCVIEAVQRRMGRAPPPPGAAPPGQQPPPGKPPPTPEEVSWARKVLGTKKSSSWEEVEKCRRNLLAKWHPDRFETQGPAAVERANAKCKEIGRAFGILSADRDRKEAA